MGSWGCAGGNHQPLTCLPISTQYHMRIHKEERKYLCPECGYKCKWVNQLKYHMTKHTGECQARGGQAAGHSRAGQSTAPAVPSQPGQGVADSLLGKSKHCGLP